jgi:glyoxylase-like metal-dependent hydrolase (beta-lactamase superfamily II)
LEEIGWRPTDLRIIINTHVHAYHAGGNGEMQEVSGAAIHVHKLDAAFADHETYIEKYCRDNLRLMGQSTRIPHAEALQHQKLGREWGVVRVLE